MADLEFKGTPFIDPGIVAPRQPKPTFRLTPTGAIADAFSVGTIFGASRSYDIPAEDGFDAWANGRLDNASSAMTFALAPSRSEAEFQQRLAHFNDMEYRRRRLADSGTEAMLISMAVETFADPTTYIPLAGAVKTAGSTLQAARRGALLGGGSAFVMEGAMQGVDPGRDMLSMVTSPVFGGMIGAGAGALTYRVVQKQADAAAHLATRMEELRKMREESGEGVSFDTTGVPAVIPGVPSTLEADPAKWHKPSANEIRSQLEAAFPGDTFLLRSFDALPSHLKDNVGEFFVSPHVRPDGVRGQYNHLEDALSVFGGEPAFTTAHEFGHRASLWSKPSTVKSLFRLFQEDILNNPKIASNAELLMGKVLDDKATGMHVFQRLVYDTDFNEWYANNFADLVLRVARGEAPALNTPIERGIWASVSEFFAETMSYIKNFARSDQEKDALLASLKTRIDRQIRLSIQEIDGKFPDNSWERMNKFNELTKEEFLRIFSKLGETLGQNSSIAKLAAEAKNKNNEKNKVEIIAQHIFKMADLKVSKYGSRVLGNSDDLVRNFSADIANGLNLGTTYVAYLDKNFPDWKKMSGGGSDLIELFNYLNRTGYGKFVEVQQDLDAIKATLPKMQELADEMRLNGKIEGLADLPLHDRSPLFDYLLEAIRHGSEGTNFPHDISKLDVFGDSPMKYSLSPAARQMVRPDDFRIAKTGTGIENLPITLGTRLLKYSSPTVREAGLKLISYGGFLQNEIDGKGIARVQSVEASMSINWHNKLASAIFAIDEGYLNYRKAVGQSRVGKHVNLLVSDLIHGRNGAMSQAEFRSEVFRAMYSGDAHSNPAIADVARSLRPFFDEIGESANKQRLFTYEQRKVADWLNAEIKDLTEQLEKLKNTSADVGGAADRSRQARKAEQEKARAKDAEDGDWANQAAEEEALLNKEGALKEARIASDSAGRMSRLEQLMAPLEKRLAARQKHLDDIEAQIKRIESGGWKDLMGDKSYVPRFIDRSKVRDNIPGLRQKLTDYYTARGVKPERVEELVDEEIERLMNRSEFTPLYDDPSKIKSAHLRSREMSSELLHDYLETDIEKVMRHYVRTMTADIEISKAFGEDFDLAKTLGGIKDEYMERIKAESNPATARKLAEEMDDVMRDLRGARDLVRGTYGIPTDPDAMHWRVLKGMRTFNYLTMMGGVALSALPDVVRPIMVQGLSDTFKYGMKPLLANLDAIKMTRTESNSAALALDMVLYTRMGAFLDFGPGMGGKASAFERNLNNAGSAFSLLNLLNPWTDMIKMWSGAVIGSSMLDKTWSLGQHGNFTDETLRMLNRAGIDETTAKEISGQFAKYGDIRIGKGEAMRPLVAAAEKAGGDGKAVIEDWVDKVRAQGGVWLANTELWDNQKAAMVFRNALYEDVNRTIVTPSIGDRSLFMSTEMGRTIFQFKGFALASTQRVLVAGLQEGDSKFWTGAAAITAAGVVADYLKTEVQYRKDWSRKSTGDIIVSAIDRGGLMGIFSDANTILEKLTHNQLGARPLLGDKGKATMGSTKIGAIAGPSAQQGINFYGVLNDTLSGKSDERTATTMRMLMPGAGLFYLQPPMEALGIP
jgi:hypothetical protein